MFSFGSFHGLSIESFKLFIKFHMYAYIYFLSLRYPAEASTTSKNVVMALTKTVEKQIGRLINFESCMKMKKIQSDLTIRNY